MEEPLVTALFITVVGMTLLFLSLVLFYGLLTLMTAVLKDRKSEQEGEIAYEGRKEVPRDGREGAVLKAAALAVALARAEMEKEGDQAVDEHSAAGTDSSWWTLHHQRRLARAPKARRMR